MGLKRLSTKDNYKVRCNHSRGSYEFNFETRKCKKILVIGTIVIVLLGGNYLVHKYKDKKIENLKEKNSQSLVLDNGDGTQSTSIAKGVEDKVIEMKEDLTNHGKHIMFSHKLTAKELEALDLTFKEELSWGGDVEIVNNAQITFEYLSDPSKFSVRRYPTGNYHVEISRDSFEARAILEGKELVKTKLSAGGKLQQALDFKKVDFIKEAQNKAEKKIREDSQKAAEKSLGDQETIDKLYKVSTEYYKKYLKKFGVKVYVTFE